MTVKGGRKGKWAGVGNLKKLLAARWRSRETHARGRCCLSPPARTCHPCYGREVSQSCKPILRVKGNGLGTWSVGVQVKSSAEIMHGCSSAFGSIKLQYMARRTPSSGSEARDRHSIVLQTERRFDCIHIVDVLRTSGCYACCLLIMRDAAALES